jgi:hypothetical protein
VEVVLREPRKPSTEWWQVIAALRDLGCEVRLANSGKPLDVVVIDGSLVWCGDVAPLICPEHCQVDTTVPFRNPHSSHFLQKWWFRLERPGGRGPPVRLFCASLLPTSGWDAGPRHSHIRGYRDRWCGALPPRPAYRCSGMAGVDTVSKRAWRISPLLREGKVSRLGLASKLGPRLPGRSWYGLVLCCS